MQFLDYTPSLAQDFERINREWIQDMFVLEPIDQQVIGDPQTFINLRSA